ncbi:MAG: PDZ domain-containing protein [Austwickia sp.]|nr:PDZ domain-containing protein [Austwickia sp.]MBK8435941.1 PDZ domain-containing protein [Austwickia sp.]MBK9101625.1 PDZ domain-containing protein [Austwickia sp.]
MNDDPTPRLPTLRTGRGAPTYQGWPRAPWELSATSRRWLLMLVAVLLVGAVGSLVTVPYVVYRPGSAFNALSTAPGGQDPMISVTGATTYPTQGALDVTTVALYGGPGFELTVWDWVRFRMQGAEFVDRDVVYPPEVTRDQISEVNKAEMVGSQQEAIAVALRATGRRVAEQAVIGQVHPDGPSAGKLRDGDVLTSVNGTPIEIVTDVSRLIQRAQPGTPVTLGVLRSGTRLSVPVTPVQVQGRRLLRVQLGSRFSFPVNVTINAGDVGGPSAGLIFSLAVFDKLTPGSLTGGQKIAGTGTIGSDGAVGPIGGIEHKMAGAAEAGAGWFLAPVANCTAVTGQVPQGLRVVKVATFEDARNAVETIAAGAGDGLPGC